MTNKLAPPDKKKRESRYAIRLRPRQTARLKRLGRIEHRHLAERVRAALDTALDQWEQSHPVNGRPVSKL